MTSIIKWAPFFEPFEDMDKAFGSMLPTLRDNSAFMPAVDVYETEDSVIVETQLAGIDPNKVDVSIENDILSIKGESEKKSEVDEKNYYRKEIRRGSFFRSVQLPVHVQGDAARAVAGSGILKITIPKTKESKPNKIKIESAQ